MRLADAILYLATDEKGLVAGLDSAKNKTNSWASSLGAGVSNRLGDITRGAFERVGQMTTNLLVGGMRAATGGIMESIDAASDLGESINKVNVVFEDAAASVLKWSENSATALGQSRQQALEAVGTFGNLFDAMGMSSEMTGEMSMGLVELASDLASFNNIDPAEALEKLRAGIVGETEPLRTLGVNLSAVAIEAKALSSGIVKTDVDMTKLNRATLNLEKANADAAEALRDHGESSIEYRDAAQKVAEAEEQITKVMEGKKPVLTAAEKAQAAYMLIMEQTANAQGDFARTSDGAANASRIAAAQMANLKATIGNALLPVWNELLIAFNAALKDSMPAIAQFVQTVLAPAILRLVEGVKDWVNWFLKLSPTTQAIIGGIAGIVVVLIPLLAVLAPVFSVFSGLASLFGLIAPLLGTIGGSLSFLIGPIGLAIVAVGALAIAWQQNWFGIRDITSNVIGSVTSMIADFAANSNFVWSPEFKQIKLGDLFEFASGDGSTKITLGDFFDFSSTPEITQLSLGDFFSFASDGSGTKISWSDIFSFSSDSSTGIVKLTVGDLIDVEGFGVSGALGSAFSALGTLISDKAGEAATKITAALPPAWVDALSTWKPSDVAPTWVVSLTNWKPATETVTWVSDLITWNPDAKTPTWITDLLAWTPVTETVQWVADLVAWNPDAKTPQWITDMLAWKPSDGAPQWITDLTNWKPSADTPQWIVELINWQPAAVTWVADLIAWAFPDLPADLNSLISWAFPDLPGDLSTLLNWKFPSLPADVNALVTWIFPDPPSTVSDLVAWTFPEFSEGLLSTWNLIFAWKFPDFSGELAAMWNRIFGWKFPDAPGWISTLLNWTPATPSWVSSLLSWSPSLPSLPSWLGGGGSDSGSTSGGSGKSGNGRSALGGGTTVNVYIENVNNNMDVEQIAYKIQQRLAGV